MEQKKYKARKSKPGVKKLAQIND
ncbi:uncharacterized protein G2W53_024975 [Senna tora]|uniref:Uncharacterized protein n=1 Tax=Senna tora TaxID=362788 RepID=A0A834TE77_9FABA|nr:uncharacterized protein G2W53_024975 [Senna tora]